MLTKRIVVIISKYMEVKPSYHMPETHTVMWVNWISIELGAGRERLVFQKSPSTSVG